MGLSSIVDNQGENTLQNALARIAKGAIQWDIASAFFSIEALALLADALEPIEKIRILIGDDADATQRIRLVNLLKSRSDEDLLKLRENHPLLLTLKKVEPLFTSGRVEARCYTRRKFHAKASITLRDADSDGDPIRGIVGSGNFTRAGLTQNIELNVRLNIDQVGTLKTWFDERWEEADPVPVTKIMGEEIGRHLKLYEPYLIYRKALALWGASRQDEAATVSGLLADKLDPHQEVGYKQALRILERENGVLICDGVGLGKSFIALALMERFCREGKRVLLIAPKAILESSWKGYLKQYLADYEEDFGSLVDRPMTFFGFDANPESNDPATIRNVEALRKLSERADVIVIDESHNFRTTSAARYKNLYRVLAPQRNGRKKMVLLTATPINTAYRDLAVQMALITHDEGSIAGISVASLLGAANALDIQARAGNGQSATGGGQMLLDLLGLDRPQTNDDILRAAIEAVVIQRSRATCIALAGEKELRFPIRRKPEAIEYNFDGGGALYRSVVLTTERRFKPGIAFFRELKQAEEEAQTKGKKFDPTKILQKKTEGIKFAAFLPELYKRQSAVERDAKREQDELRLTGLVYANTLKQLESSPVAFQGILQSLGKGLMARLKHVLGEAANPLIATHEAWVRTPLFPQTDAIEADADTGETDTTDDLADDGETLDASGEETEDWIAKAIHERSLAKKLEGFSDKTHRVDDWKNAIAADLDYLREVHATIIAARKSEDPKLTRVVETLRKDTEEGKRVLVFTQSQRTADYLERELKRRLPKAGVARIDSRNLKIRPAVLYAFCPGYNPLPAGNWPPSVPKQVDILISTDVLSEGVNLQEARAILNYDIHWNPVRLIQRIGRVDRRLDAKITPNVHEFAIYNVLPPRDIESIIELVGRVETRTLKISRTLGLDQAFFKATDDDGTLKEFNKLYEGDSTDADKALHKFVAFSREDAPDAALQKELENLPPGAFGVWDEAPENGHFAMFTLEASKDATEADKTKFAALLGSPQPVLQWEKGKPIFDAQIFTVLEGTQAKVPSGQPTTDETALAGRLRTLRNAVRQTLATRNLPGTILPRLVCWMELRKKQEEQ